MECLRLRVRDLDFARNEIIVRDGKGAKDRVTMLPESLKAPLREHLKAIKTIHERDLADGWGRVQMPNALDRKFPNAFAEWRWQWVIPLPLTCSKAAMTFERYKSSWAIATLRRRWSIPMSPTVDQRVCAVQWMGYKTIFEVLMLIRIRCCNKNLTKRSQRNIKGLRHFLEPIAMASYTD